MVRRYMLSAEQRAADRQCLAAIRDRILAQVPGCAVAADQHYRETDLAIDYCEDVAPLADAALERIVALMRDAGLTAKVSSIHVNGWFGNHDKLSMTRIMLAECFAIDLDAQKEHFMFVGDSPNDEPMFGFFPNATGVANIRDFESRISVKPAFVTRARCGAGFAEVAEALIAARKD